MSRLFLLLSLSTLFILATANNVFVCEHDSTEECPSKLCYYSIKENCVYRGCATTAQCENRKENECYKNGDQYTCCCKTSGCTSNYRGLPLCGLKTYSAEQDEQNADSKNEDYEDVVIYTKSKRLASEATAPAIPEESKNDSEAAVLSPVAKLASQSVPKEDEEEQKLIDEAAPKVEEKAEETPSIVNTDIIKTVAFADNKHEEETAETTNVDTVKTQEEVSHHLPNEKENDAQETQQSVPAVPPAAASSVDQSAQNEDKVEDNENSENEMDSLSSKAEELQKILHQEEPTEAVTQEVQPLIPRLIEASTQAEKKTTVAATTTTEPTTTTIKITSTSTTTTTTTTIPPTTTIALPTTTETPTTRIVTTTPRPTTLRRVPASATAAVIQASQKPHVLKEDKSDEDDESVENVFYTPSPSKRPAVPERRPAVQRAKFPAQPVDLPVEPAPETSSVKSSRKEETVAPFTPPIPWWSIVLLGFIFSVAGGIVFVFFTRRRNNAQNGSANRRVEEPKNKDMLVDPLLLTKTVDERN